MSQGFGATVRQLNKAMLPHWYAYCQLCIFVYFVKNDCSSQMAVCPWQKASWKGRGHPKARLQVNFSANIYDTAEIILKCNFSNENILIEYISAGISITYQPRLECLQTGDGRRCQGTPMVAFLVRRRRRPTVIRRNGVVKKLSPGIFCQELEYESFDVFVCLIELQFVAF